MKTKATTPPITLSELDQLLRSGRGADVRKALGELELAQLPREQLADWANLARRSGMISLSLRLLQPILRLKKNLGQAASPKERASYAASLGAIGALSEAYGVLAGLEESPLPEVQLFYGFTHVYSWDYGAAVPFFERYTKLEGPSEFQKNVARVNLAAALCFLGDYDAVLALTGELIDEAAARGWVILQTEAHLLTAQAHLWSARVAESEAAIERARALSAANQLNPLHVEKWRLLLELESRGPHGDLLERVAALKTESRAARLWEIARDCDYHFAMRAQDKRLCERVYFGTPFPAYRARLLKEASAWFKPRAAYRWSLQDSAGEVLDLVEEGPASLFTRVLRSMSTDFYRPLKIGCLFNEIYPGEYYDPETSPARVKTALSRTRAHLREIGSPLEIGCVKQDYYLTSREPLDLRVRIEYPQHAATPSVPVESLRTLKMAWPHKSFSSQQAAEQLKISPLQAQRLLKLAFDEKKIYRSGVGRGRLYRFTK